MNQMILMFLNAYGDRLPTIDEIVGAALALRENMATIKSPYGTIDCCGTGGDQSGTYNISTAVSLVAAATGIPVAKHGNRASSSKSGAADVLEALGVKLEVPLSLLEQSLKEINYAFLMAPQHHKGMRFVADARKKLGRKTIFNILFSGTTFHSSSHSLSALPVLQYFLILNLLLFSLLQLTVLVSSILYNLLQLNIHHFQFQIIICSPNFLIH
jgi:hypothetical protein